LDLNNILGGDDKSIVPDSSTDDGVLTSINPAEFDSLIKILNILEKQDAIIIEDSKICQSINKGATIISTDLEDIIGKNINMHILSPKKAVKLFKAIKGNANVDIIDDDEQKRYVVTNGIVKVFLPKQAEELTVDSQPPDLSTFIPIGKSVEISKDSRSNLTSVLGEAEYCELLVHQNQMKGVYIPETAIFLFEEYASEQIDETSADMNLKSYSFLSIDGEKYDMYLGSKDDQEWLLTRVNTGFVVVDLFESVSEVTDESILI